ncbi:MAG: ribose-phosphate pyrophosphokinase [Oligoflexia bacterium]|nr:ribose-phosphate pyrophosphokinase [Oligoflexia bacterium]MBF0367317.1 ribose-phosphate pyrophosphokinase [Oligoflexia bacterium]
MKRLILVSGNSNLELSKRISTYLDVPLVDPQIIRFANGEINCRIQKNVRGADVFVVQSICSPGVNDNLMELLILIDALKRASAQSIIGVIPHYGYSRQDRKASPRTPISAKLVADLLTVAGATRVITMDVHAGQIQGFFNIPFDNIYSSPVILDYVQRELVGVGRPLQDPVCVSPDSGGVERVRHYAKKLGCEMAMIDKRRIAPNVAKAMNVVGDVKNKDVIIVDDIIDTAGTLIEAVKALKDNGARKVFACATHPVFSDPAAERMAGCQELDGVIVTDTIPLSPACAALEKVKVLTVSEILGRAIHYTFNNDSVSSLFV